MEVTQAIASLVRIATLFPIEKLVLSSQPLLIERLPPELLQATVIPQPAARQEEIHAEGEEGVVGETPDAEEGDSSPLPMPTTAETVAELRTDMAKELYRLELDLIRGGRIAGLPCDCLKKHGTLGVRAIAEELMPMDPNPLYGEVVAWMEERAAEFDPKAVAQHPPEHYRALASVVRGFRKQIT